MKMYQSHILKFIGSFLGFILLATNLAYAAAAIHLTQLDKLNISYTVKALSIQGIQAPSDNGTYQIQIKPQDQKQFELIKQVYAQQSQAVWQSNHAYNLSDFLSPAVQALIHHRYIEKQATNIPWVKKNFSDLDDQTVYTTTNCYGTVWELMRFNGSKALAPHNPFYTFWASRNQVTNVMVDNDYSSEIKKEELKTGDVVLFFDRINPMYRGMLHAAMYIDGELFFEKTDTGSEYAYRYVTFDDMKNKLQNLTTNDELEIQFLRFGEAGKKALPDPTQKLSIAFDPTYSHLADRVPKAERPYIILGEGSGTGGGIIPGLYRIESVDLIINPQTGLGQFSDKDPNTKNFVPLLFSK